MEVLFFITDNMGWIMAAGILAALIVGAVQRYREKKIYGYSPVEREFLGTAGKAMGATMFRDLPSDVTGAAPTGTSYEPNFEFDEEAERKYVEEYEQNVVFKLVLCDGDEEYFIGVFLTRMDAIEVASHYLSYVRGFKDYECAYRLDIKDVVGEGIFNCVYVAMGWDVDKNNDEINIIESDFFISRRDAVEELTELKRMVDRDEWVLECYNIDECKWREGFVRG